jgi:hypothetical protein
MPNTMISVSGAAARSADTIVCRFAVMWATSPGKPLTMHAGTWLHERAKPSTSLAPRPTVTGLTRPRFAPASTLAC